MAVAEHARPELARALAAFEREFGGRPRWAAAAPGRVNLIGEHTDYNNGFVLPIAIDRVCVVVAGPGKGRIFSEDIHESQEHGHPQSRKPVARVEWDFSRTIVAGGLGVEVGSWESYVLGVMAQFQREGPLPRLDLAVASSVPLGSGLSSSASIEVAVATVMEQVVGRKLGELEKARLVQRAEHEFAGVPCGIMDMLASISGRAGCALLIDCESCGVRPVRMPRGVRVVVVNSKVRHALAGGEYAKRRGVCESAARKLGVSSLRGARMEMLDGRLSEEEARCTRHVITETARTKEAAGALEAGDVGRLGRLFAESHASLRDDYRVSCAELDAIVEIAAPPPPRVCPGVIGARMTGGGFGGCAVVLVREGAVEELKRRMGAEYRSRVGRECEVFEVRASEGACVTAAG